MQEPIQQQSHGVIYFILNCLYRIFNFICRCFLFMGNIILSGNSRKSEFEADKFAFDVGYGKELTTALYLLQKISTGENMQLVERMQTSHPRTSLRIAKMEYMIDYKEPFFIPWVLAHICYIPQTRLTAQTILSHIPVATNFADKEKIDCFSFASWVFFQTEPPPSEMRGRFSFWKAVCFFVAAYTE